MKKIRNLNELKQVKQKLKYKQKLFEKDLTGSSTLIVDNLSDKMRDWAFSLGTTIVTQLISRFKKSNKKNR